MSRAVACHTPVSTRVTARPVAPRLEVGTRLKQAGVAFFGAALLVAAPAFADDAELLEIGEDVFTSKCVACHAGGENSVQPERVLAVEAIKSPDGIGEFSEKAIVNQVTNGKRSMPAWKDQLSGDEIAAVAKYVYTHAQDGAWPE